MEPKPKLIRTSNAAIALDVLLVGQLKFLNQYFEVIAVSGQDEHLDIVKERERIETRSVKMERKISPFRDFISLINLYRVFKKEAPLIVHSITPKAGLLCMVAAYFARVPIRIHTFTGLIFPYRRGFSQWLLLNLDRLMCFFATHIYPEGQGVKNDLTNFHITRKPLKVLANGNLNGIDTNYFNPANLIPEDLQNLKTKLGISENDFVFIFIGRLVSDKGVNELVSAFESLSETEKNVKLLLVGALESDLDPLKKITLKKIREKNSIIATGFQKDVRPFLGISNVLVLPSHREGFPNVVIQAGAMELPSIVTDINGCNEIISEGLNGSIIPSRDQNALLSAMKAYLNKDKEHMLLLGKEARKRVLERYPRSKVWQALLEEYNHIIARYKNNPIL